MTGQATRRIKTQRGLGPKVRGLQLRAKSSPTLTLGFLLRWLLQNTFQHRTKTHESLSATRLASVVTYGINSCEFYARYCLLLWFFDCARPYSWASAALIEQSTFFWAPTSVIPSVYSVNRRRKSQTRLATRPEPIWAAGP